MQFTFDLFSYGSFFILAVLCFFLGFSGAWIMGRFAPGWGLVDTPSARSSHDLPTPRGGGVGILVAFCFSGVVLSQPWWLFALPALLGLLSLFDDRMDLSVRTRILVQFSVAVCAVAMLPMDLWPAPPGGVLLGVFLVVFIVGTTNFFNFMDGINGIAGIAGAVTFFLIGCFAAFNPAQGLQAEIFLCFGMAMACLGFLPLNLPSGRVFMGDVGSISIGFILAVLICSMSRGVADFVCLSSFLFMFYADCMTTLFIRWRDGEKLSQAHRRHLYQILVNEGKNTHHSIARLYGALQLLLGGVMLGAWHFGLAWQIGVCLTAFILFVIASFRIRKSISPACSRERRGGQEKRMAGNNVDDLLGDLNLGRGAQPLTDYSALSNESSERGV